MMLAGAGVKKGFSYGATDDFSYNITKDPVHVHDLNATILHLMGVDHKKLTYKFQGRDYRGMAVSQNKRAPGSYIVDIPVIILINQPGTFPLFEENRTATYTFKSAYRGINATGNKLFCGGKEVFRMAVVA